MVDLKDGNYVDEDGDLVWVKDGEFHCADGPAILYGTERVVHGAVLGYTARSSWWLYGRGYEFEEWLELNTELSAEAKVMMKLEYG